MGIWGTAAANVISGLVVLGATARLGYFIAVRYTYKREAAQARQQRNLAAAAELYRVYGDFFAAWKVWNAHLRSAKPPSGAQLAQLGPPDDRRRSELLTAAAQAEGGFEALLIRLALEHNLTDDQRTTLWCLRSASQQLRRAMKAGEPLLWWKSDIHSGDVGHDGYRAYQAFKKLTSLSAGMLLDARDMPAVESRLQALRQVTSSVKEFTTRDGRFNQAIEAERTARLCSPDRAQRDWEWIVVAEQLQPAEVASPRGTMDRQQPR